MLCNTDMTRMLKQIVGKDAEFRGLQEQSCK